MRRLPKGVPSIAGNPVDAFIEAAPGKRTLPWMGPNVRSDLLVNVNVKLPERLVLQLHWLAAERDEHKRAIVERALSELMERELAARGLPT